MKNVGATNGRPFILPQFFALFNDCKTKNLVKTLKKIYFLDIFVNYIYNIEI